MTRRMRGESQKTEQNDRKGKLKWEARKEVMEKKQTSRETKENRRGVRMGAKGQLKEN